MRYNLIAVAAMFVVPMLLAVFFMDEEKAKAEIAVRDISTSFHLSSFLSASFSITLPPPTCLFLPLSYTSLFLLPPALHFLITSIIHQRYCFLSAKYCGQLAFTTAIPLFEPSKGQNCQNSRKNLRVLIANFSCLWACEKTCASPLLIVLGSMLDRIERPCCLEEQGSAFLL